MYNCIFNKTHSAYDPVLMCAFFLCVEIRSLSECLLNFNIAVFSTVFHLFTLNNVVPFFLEVKLTFLPVFFRPASSPWSPVNITGSTI